MYMEQTRVIAWEREVVRKGKRNVVSTSRKRIRYYASFVLMYQDQRPNSPQTAAKRPIELVLDCQGKGRGTEVFFIEGDTSTSGYFHVMARYPNGRCRPLVADKLVCNSTRQGHGVIEVHLPYKRLPTAFRDGQVIAWSFVLGGFTAMVMSAWMLAKEAFAM